MFLSNKTTRILLEFQKNEITEYHIYRKLARHTESAGNRKVLEDIANDELRHYDVWKSCTKMDVQPNRLKVFWYVLIGRIFGLTFGLKLMERGEKGAQKSYDQLETDYPQARDISEEEEAHEHQLLQLLDEERLRYTGSLVLGLNDALVELTGALAGLTFALQNTKLVALTGSITGFAAALSMASSEYLSTKADGDGKNALKASLYTGTAYIFTVALLILPYLTFNNQLLCLGCTLAFAVLVIAVFNFYISVAKDQHFKTRFFEMTGLSFGVALLSFAAGFLLRRFFGTDV